MYNVHPYFSFRNLSTNVCIIISFRDFFSLKDKKQINKIHFTFKNGLSQAGKWIDKYQPNQISEKKDEHKMVLERQPTT